MRHKPIKVGAKFDLKFVEVAERLVAAGFTEKDLGYAMGVAFTTIQSWKRRYPEFKRACKAGRELAKQSIIAHSIKAAIGYDWEKVVKSYGPDGQLKATKTIVEHERPDSKMAMFLLCNLDPERWKVQRELKIDQRSISLKIDGKADAEAIRRLCGKIYSAYSEPIDGELVVQGVTGSGNSEGRELQEGLPTDVQREAANSL